MPESLFSFIVWDVSPEIFQFNGLAVRWYGLLFALGFLIGQQLLIRIYKWEGRSEKDVETLTIYMVIATVVGARLGHVLFYEPLDYLRNPIEILKIWKGGLASHGATVGILLALYLYSKKATNQSYLYVLDRIVITIALVGALIRLGNLMNSEIVGVPTNAVTGFIFVHDVEQGLKEIFDENIEEVDFEKTDRDTTIAGFTYEGMNMVVKLSPHVSSKQQAAEDILTILRTSSFAEENVLAPYSSSKYKIENNFIIFNLYGIPRHPAQLYEAISSFLLFLLLFWIYYRKKEKLQEGRIFALFVIVIFGLRIIYEFFKEPQVEFERTMVLNMGQILSIPMVIIGIFILVKSLRKKDEIV